MTTGARLAAQSSFLQADAVAMRGLSARRTPPKSATPTVDDLYNNTVSAQATIRPKPATPFLQSTPSFAIGAGGVERVGSATASPELEGSSTELLHQNFSGKLSQMTLRAGVADKVTIKADVGQFRSRLNGRHGKF